MRQTYERALIRSLYEYVRAGELDLAIDMCRQSDQSWRAASLSGGTLYRDPALSSRGDDLEMEMEVEEEADQRAHGNTNRRLWKSMCRKFAATVRLLTLCKRIALTKSAHSRILIRSSELSTALSLVIPCRCCRSVLHGRITSGFTSTHFSNRTSKPVSHHRLKGDSGLVEQSIRSVPLLLTRMDTTRYSIPRQAEMCGTNWKVSLSDCCETTRQNSE